MDDSLKSDRIFAFAHIFNWTDVAEGIKELYPNVTSLITPPPNEARDQSKVPNELGAELLKKWYNQDGYKSFKQSLKENLDGAVA